MLSLSMSREVVSLPFSILGVGSLSRGRGLCIRLSLGIVVILCRPPERETPLQREKERPPPKERGRHRPTFQRERERKTPPEKETPSRERVSDQPPETESSHHQEKERDICTDHALRKREREPTPKRETK